MLEHNVSVNTSIDADLNPFVEDEVLLNRLMMMAMLMMGCSSHHRSIDVVDWMFISSLTSHRRLSEDEGLAFRLEVMLMVRCSSHHSHIIVDYVRMRC